MYLIAAQTCVLVDTWTSLSGRIRHISGVGISIQACLTGRTPPTRRWLAQWVERASSVQRFGPRCSSRVRVPTWGLLHVTPISLILFVVILSAVLSIKPYKGKKNPMSDEDKLEEAAGKTNVKMTSLNLPTHPPEPDRRVRWMEATMIMNLTDQDQNSTEVQYSDFKNMRLQVCMDRQSLRTTSVYCYWLNFLLLA